MNLAITKSLVALVFSAAIATGAGAAHAAPAGIALQPADTATTTAAPLGTVSTGSALVDQLWAPPVSPSGAALAWTILPLASPSAAALCPTVTQSLSCDALILLYTPSAALMHAI